MKKLNLAIIGQGRSGKDIHGVYYLSADNKYFNVKYVVDADEQCRRISEERYKGCKTFPSYRDLLPLKDIDLVVNASYSYQHFGITKELLENKFNVLVEKPFARNRFECDTLIKTARDNGVVLGVFQNTFPAPYCIHALELAKNGTLGKVEQVSIRFNGFARRWDWQTLQKKMGGSCYNTGPHPFGIALEFLDFDPSTRVAFSKLDSTSLTSGDSDDYAKVILTAPNKPVVDVEINSTDAFCDYNVKIQGDRGTFKATTCDYKLKYIADGENPPRPVVEGSLRDGNHNPIYCGEKLNFDEEEGKYERTAFDEGTAGIYEGMYKAIALGEKLTVTPEQAAMIVGVIEEIHAANPMPVKFS